MGRRIATPSTVSAALAAANPSPGYYRIRNWNSDKYLAIGNSSTANGAPAIQWEYTGSNGQLWYLNADRKIVNVASGKCLAIGSGNPANGIPVVQWEELDSDSQRWIIDPSSGLIRNVQTGKYMAVGAGSTENGAEVIQWEATGSDGQRWY
ncbi:putative carbohydrate-binding protein [Mycobacterium tuberculosis]|nr:putative carbohydrate-binding protein [Mycobacterium tuberculosis]